LLGFGGHKSAAGLSIKNSFLEEFKANLEQLSLTIPKEDFVSNDDLLGEIDPKEIDFALIEILESYEPYGQKNPKPKFLIKDAKVKSKRVLGVSQNHLQLLLDCEKRDLNSIYFNFTKKASEGDRIDLICSIAKNEFRGQRTIQLIVERIDPLLDS
jgi:single-stranded-DNA-specific exonuclease